MDPWRWSSARTGLIAWEDGERFIYMLPCRSCGNLSYREARRNNARRSMNKGGIFSRVGEGWSLKTSFERREERHGREPDRKNRCWDWSWLLSMNASPWNNPIKGLAAGYQGVAYALESLGRPIFIFILFLGHYPWDPPPKIECVESVPTSCFVLSSEILEIEFFFFRHWLIS